MSNSYTIACHTCKVRIDMWQYGTETVRKKVKEWEKISHSAHVVDYFSDAGCGWDDDFDKLYDSVMEYKEVYE